MNFDLRKIGLVNLTASCFPNLTKHSFTESNNHNTI